MRKITVSYPLAILVLLALVAQNVIVNGQSGNSSISGTVRCGGDACFAVGLAYGDPINAAGKVVAIMTTALDPNTGYARPDLPTTNAQALFEVSAHGHYMLQGLLPGVYDLYAAANGYHTTLVESGFTVHVGQSLFLDAYVTPCPIIGCT